MKNVHHADVTCIEDHLLTFKLRFRISHNIRIFRWNFIFFSILIPTISHEKFIYMFVHYILYRGSWGTDVIRETSWFYRNHRKSLISNI